MVGDGNCGSRITWCSMANTLAAGNITWCSMANTLAAGNNIMVHVLQDNEPPVGPLG